MSVGVHSVKHNIWKATSVFTLERNLISAQNAVSQVPNPLISNNTWSDNRQQLTSFGLRQHIVIVIIVLRHIQLGLLLFFLWLHHHNNMIFVNKIILILLFRSLWWWWWWWSLIFVSISVKWAQGAPDEPVWVGHFVDTIKELCASKNPAKRVFNPFN